MTAAKRILCAAAAVIMSAVLIFGVLFIAAEAEHDCIGEDCPVCAVISLFVNALKTLSKAGISAPLTALFSFFIILRLYYYLSVIKTPVTLRIRLIN